MTSSKAQTKSQYFTKIFRLSKASRERIDTGGNVCVIIPPSPRPGEREDSEKEKKKIARKKERRATFILGKSAKN